MENLQFQRELHRSVRHDENIMLVVKATAYELPYIPIRQTGSEVCLQDFILDVSRVL